MPAETTLAQRLGVTTHVSPLRRKVERLRLEYPITDASTVEDWLLDIANTRGATVVSRSIQKLQANLATVPREHLSNSELVAAICLPHNLDRPQWLRAAAQLISRGDIDIDELILLSERERIAPILAELATQALRSAPNHPLWQKLAVLGEGHPPLRDSLVHWTRLAEAVRTGRVPGAAQWKQVG